MSQWSPSSSPRPHARSTPAGPGSLILRWRISLPSQRTGRQPRSPAARLARGPAGRMTSAVGNAGGSTAACSAACTAWLRRGHGRRQAPWSGRPCYHTANLATA
eukprot:11179918-Lingulodinium_polyedra.AAC.1